MHREFYKPAIISAFRSSLPPIRNDLAASLRARPTKSWDSGENRRSHPGVECAKVGIFEVTGDYGSALQAISFGL
jgi:hypothetical protein